MRLTMKKRVTIITACLILLFVHLGFTSAFAKPTLEQVRFDTPGPHEDRVTFKLNGAYLPKTFALKGDRPRVIFDFPEVVPTKKVKNTIQTKGTFIKSIRTGIHTGKNPKTRIVFDLQPGMLVDFDQNFDKGTNTLVIRVFAAGMPPGPIAAEQTEPEAVPEEKPEQVKAAEKAKEETPRTPAIASPAPQEATRPEPVPQVKETAPVEPTPVAEAEAEEPEMQQEKKAAQQETTPAASVPPPDMVEAVVKPEMKESTVIQPLSAIGETEKKAAEKVIPTLYKVEFDDTSHRGEIVTFKLNSFNPPVVFGIEEDVPRIVCFFKDTSAGDKLGEIIKSGGKFIKNIKIGTYRNPDNIRVVLDLEPGKNYDLQQIFFKEDKLFMIIINTTGEKVVN